MREDNKIYWLVLVSIFLSPLLFRTIVDTPVVTVTGGTRVDENYSMAQKTITVASSKNIENNQAVTDSSQEHLSGAIQGGHQALQFSSLSSSASFSRHIMCKDYQVVISIPPRYNPIEPTTIFRPSDTKAVILTTISVDNKMEFRWYYRSNSSKTWVFCYNWTQNFPRPGEYDYAGYLYIAGYWPGSNYPRAYEVEVYLDGSPSPAFSEFFEVTNGGLNSPRMCNDVDLNGNPVFVKSRFTIGIDTKVHHYLRFDKIAYFNEKLGFSHNFTTVWIQPNDRSYKTYSGSFLDYKDANVNWNYWQSKCISDDYISINSSTPVGNWKVEVYLDTYFNNTWMQYGPVATTPFIVGNRTVADWTFMVYLDSDVNTTGTENAAIEIFEKMASVGSSPKVNIVVQMDRIPGQNSSYDDWTDCKRFNVIKGMTPTPENATLDLGEVNMGDPNTLRDFINWTINNYPANYYFLVLWDHGAGYVGCCFDSSTPSPTDFLSLPELSQALSNLPAIMDVVLFDACGMSMTEVAYQIKDCANVLIGEEGLGWSPAPYNDYLSALTSNPSISPNTFAQEVITRYIDWCKLFGQISSATMSATDLTNITSLTAAIDDFALNLKEKEITYHEQISLARNQTQGYVGPYQNQSGYFIDLYDFARLTYQYVTNEELRNTANRMMTTLKNVIIIQDNKNSPNSHGLSICFPDERGKYDNYKTEYEQTTFAEGTLWDEFVKHYLDIQTSGCVLTIQTTYPAISVKVGEEPYETDAQGRLRLFVLPSDSYNVTVPTLVSNVTGPGSQGVFIQWDDYVANPSRNITVTGSATYTASYKTRYYFAITSLYGSPTLTSRWFEAGEALNVSVTSPVPGPPGTRYVCTGWSGSGSVSMSGATTYVVFMIENFSSITWNWKTHYLLTIRLDPTGLSPQPNVSPQGPWYDNGTAVNCTAQTISGYAFDHWTVDGANWDQGISSISITMDGPHELTTHYVRSLAWWETIFGSEMPKAILGLVGIVLTVTLVGTAWFRTQRRKGIAKAPQPIPIEVSEALPDRITTGYADLDNLLFGGIPENYAVILTSPSCDERDLLIKRFLETGAKKGEVTFYVTIDPAEAKSLAAEFQSNFYLFICNPQADTIIKESLPNVFKLKGVENLTEISIALTSAFRRLEESLRVPRRACIEIISDVLLQHQAVQTRRWLTDLVTELRSRGFTTLAVMTPQMHHPEEVHAILDLFEGEINISEKEAVGLEKFLKVRKMYNQKYVEAELPLRKDRLE